jgi:beta-lactamase class D
MKHTFFLITLIVSFSFWSSISAATEVVERADLQRFFDDEGVEGTFVVLSTDPDRLILVNEERAETRFNPASTFKIANSLIALETAVVADENEVVPYGGKPQIIAAWEKDMSMRDAIEISNVPVFQELARQIGLMRYNEWLKILGYGNISAGNNVETFWLDGPLKISAIVQVYFLEKLATKALSASPRNQTIVADIIKLNTANGKTLYGKTGWTAAPNPDIGWFVGWVSDGDTIHTFALNIDINKRSGQTSKVHC